MHKSLFRWRLGATVLIICLMLAFNTVVILAQDATDEPPAASTEPTETETPLPIPTDTPTAIPTVEEPTLAPTDIPVEVTETPVATEETVTPEATEVATEAPPTEATAETPTVVAPVAEEPPLSLLVRELFDNNDLSPWLPGTGWSLAAREGGLALQVVNSNDPIVLQKGAFYNVAVQTRFLWTTGSAQISVRKTAVGNYTASIDAAGNISLKRADGVVATSVVAPVPAGTWRTLRLSAVNDVIRVAIDDVEVITYSDIAPLPPGDISLSADFNPAVGDTNPTPEVQTLLADDFFLWVPLDELGLYPAPTPISAPTAAPTEPLPTEVATDVVVETTTEPTEAVVEPTEVPTEVVTEVPATATEVAPVKQAGPQDDLTHVVGKDVSEAAPPSPEELAAAQDSGNDDFGLPQNVLLNSLGFFVFSDGTIDATLEGSEPSPICAQGLGHTVWFKFTPPTDGTYTFSTAGSSFDTVMTVYTGTALNNLASVGCNDDVNATVLTSQLILTGLSHLTEYKIQVGGNHGRYGAYSFRVQQGSAPTTLPAPVIVAPSPATGTNSNLAAPTFTWNKIATNTNSYEIQVATNATFTTGLQLGFINATTCAATCVYTVSPALTTPGTYYWRVRGRTLNDAGGAFNTPVRTFIYRTDAPVLKLPNDAAVVTTGRPALSWNAYTGATYTIQIDDNSNFSSPVGTFTPTPATGLTYTPLVALPPGDWYWHVKALPALNNGGDTGYGAARKFTVNLFTTPTDNFVTADTTPTFTWKTAGVVVSPTPATQYQIEIDRATTFNSNAGGPDYVATDLTALTYTPATPFTAFNGSDYGTYYWRVRISTDGGATYPLAATNTPYRKLYISPSAPAVPVLLAPAASVFTADTTPVLDWNPIATATGGPFSYDVQVCANATCTTTIYDSVNVPAPVPADDTDYEVGTPLTPGAYYWRVRSVNTIGLTSNYSAARMFTVRTSILSTPADSSSTADTTPAFTWLPITYSSTIPAVAVKYRLEADTATTFNSAAGQPEYAVQGLTTTTHTVPAATPLAKDTWYWRVKISTDGGATYPTVVGSYYTLYILSSVPAAPTYPLTPAAATVFASQTPHLDVNNVPNGTDWTVASYDFQVATNNLFTQNVLSFTALPTSDFAPSTLAAGAYFFRGRAVTTTGAPGNWSAARAFTIRTTPPVLSAPAAGAVTTDTTPMLSWLTFGIGAKYKIEIAKNTAFTVGVVTNATPLTTLNFTVPVANTLTEGVWYWHVKAIDPNNDETVYSEYRILYVSTHTLLPAPILVSPVTGFSTNPQPTLVWNAVTAPAGVTLDHYQVQLATNAAFTTGLQTSLDIPLNSPTVSYTTVGLGAGTWYWRVRAFNSNGVPGAVSAVRNFTFDTTALALAPTLSLPADNSSSTVKNPNFTWTKPVGAVRFEIRYSSNYPATYNPGDALTTIGTVAITNLTPTTLLTATTYKPPSPLIPGTYYWQVRAFDAASNPSPWSNLKTFKIFSANTDTPQPNRFGPSDTILLTWGPLSWVTNGAGYYEIQIDNNPIAANALAASPEYELRGDPATTGNGVSYLVYVNLNNYGVVIPAGSLPAGLPNGTWYWHVRGYNPTTHAYGSWSSTGTFVVDK